VASGHAYRGTLARVGPPGNISHQSSFVSASFVDRSTAGHAVCRLRQVDVFALSFLAHRGQHLHQAASSNRRRNRSLRVEPDVIQQFDGISFLSLLDSADRFFNQLRNSGVVDVLFNRYAKYRAANSSNRCTRVSHAARIDSYMSISSSPVS